MSPSSRIPPEPKDPARLVGERCWYVSAGGSTWPSFQLVLGERVPRREPLDSPHHDEAFRLHTGSSGLMVWSAWRLEGASGVLAASGQDEEAAAPVLRRLQGDTVVAVACSPRRDLRLGFASGLALVTFSDRLADDPAAITNWDLTIDE